MRRADPSRLVSKGCVKRSWGAVFKKTCHNNALADVVEIECAMFEILRVCFCVWVTAAFCFGSAAATSASGCHNAECQTTGTHSTAKKRPSPEARAARVCSSTTKAGGLFPLLVAPSMRTDSLQANQFNGCAILRSRPLPAALRVSWPAFRLIHRCDGAERSRGTGSGSGVSLRTGGDCVNA